MNARNLSNVPPSCPSKKYRKYRHRRDVSLTVFGRVPQPSVLGGLCELRMVLRRLRVLTPPLLFQAPSSRIFFNLPLRSNDIQEIN